MNEDKLQNGIDDAIKKKAGFAIVGIGELTETQLLPAFSKCKYAVLAALISDDVVKAKELADKYNIEDIYSYDDFESIANNPFIDIVYIVLPNSLHKEFTVKSAKAGKHVLCEKPMAANIAEAKDMITACEEAGKKLMIAYRIQLEPHNQLMKEWLQDDKFGKVKIIECFNGELVDDPTQWRFKKALSGGGVLMDLGIYCINTLRFLTGKEPEWVSANIYSTPGDERFKEVEETVLFHMGFADGLVASCGTSYGINGYQRYRCFTGNKTWFGLNPAFAYQKIKIETSANEDGEKISIPFVKETDQFSAVMDHMAECVLKDRKVLTPGEEGLKDHLVINAIYRSAKEKRVVYLNEDS